MATESTKKARTDVMPYEHRGKAICSCAENPSRISELVLALSVERDAALRKCIVRALLGITNSAAPRELLCNLAALSVALPSEAEMDEIIAWRLPY
jgi:hypothetical protein